MADLGSFHEYDIAEADILLMYLDEVIAERDKVRHRGIGDEI